MAEGQSGLCPNCGDNISNISASFGEALIWEDSVNARSWDLTSLPGIEIWVPILDMYERNCFGLDSELRGRDNSPHQEASKNKIDRYIARRSRTASTVTTRVTRPNIGVYIHLVS